ncbi:hypothetical protein Btru_030474 [Bulinus truncatus]|nr:hypothetical protein Btru_030474 [Bulinus truncatus]
MTGDEGHMTFISDSRPISPPRSSITTGSIDHHRSSARNMREREDQSMHGSLLRDLSIESLGPNHCWYNLPNTDNTSTDNYDQDKTVSTTKVISLVTPCQGVSQSCCGSNSKTLFQSEDVFIINSTALYRNDLSHVNGMQAVPTQGSIFSISSSETNNHRSTPPHGDYPEPSKSRAGMTVFTNLRVRGKEPKSLGRFLQLNRKDSVSQIKGVKFQSFSNANDKSGNLSQTVCGSLSDINQSSKHPILGHISPNDLGTSSEKNDYKSSQMITHRLEAANRKDAVPHRSHKTSSTTDSSNGAGEEGAIDSDVTVRTGHCRCADLSTQRGRRNHALMIMLVSVIPVIVILIQNSIGVYSHSSDLKQHNVVKGEILFSSVEIGNVLHRTQIERGTTALYVSSKAEVTTLHPYVACCRSARMKGESMRYLLLDRQGSGTWSHWKEMSPQSRDEKKKFELSYMQSDQTVLKNLTAAYLETDKAISSLTRWVVEPNITYFQSADEYHERIKDFRSLVLSSSVPNVTIPQVIKFYSDDNAVIVRWVGQFIQHSKSGDLWKTLVGYYMLILSKEQAGVERALGSTYYAKGGYNDQEMLDYLERKILGMTYLERCTEYSATVFTLLKNVFYGKETDVNLQRMRNEILHNALNGSDVTMGAKWFNNMTKYINILKTLLEVSERKKTSVPQTGLAKTERLLATEIFIVKRAVIWLRHGAHWSSDSSDLSCRPVRPGGHCQQQCYPNVLLGIVPIKSACDANSTYSTCCTETDACLRPNAALFDEMYAQCSGKSICKRGPTMTSAWMMNGCDMGKYNAYATYLKVEYECLADDPLTTTPTAKPTTTLPASTATYSNNLTMGEQAAIICCIMLFIFIIAAAVVIYKRIKYGPPEDFRKLFSKPHVEGAESPGVTPWIAGEAQEQVYNVIAEKQKKKKKKFPKFKF